MKIAVRYQSRGGNTKAVAEAIAKASDVKAEPIDVPLTEPVDILFVGGGVYAWSLDSALKDYLHALDTNMVKSIAAFSTAGCMDGAKRIEEVVTERGIAVCKNNLPIMVGTKNHAWLGGKGHIELSEKQLEKINNFVKATTN